MNILIVGDNNFWYYYGEDDNKEEALKEVIEGIKTGAYAHPCEPSCLRIFEFTHMETKNLEEVI